jgi:hypothetical protein
MGFLFIKLFDYKRYKSVSGIPLKYTGGTAGGEKAAVNQKLLPEVHTIQCFIS